MDDLRHTLVNQSKNIHGNDHPKFVLDSNKFTDVCCICQEKMIKNVSEYANPNEMFENTLMMTLCYHVFHKKCLSQWSLIQFVCPICRAPLNAQTE